MLYNGESCHLRIKNNRSGSEAEGLKGSVSLREILNDQGQKYFGLSIDILHETCVS